MKAQQREEGIEVQGLERVVIEAYFLSPLEHLVLTVLRDCHQNRAPCVPRTHGLIGQPAADLMGR
jgi:hypothetical protein